MLVRHHLGGASGVISPAVTHWPSSGTREPGPDRRCRLSGNQDHCEVAPTRTEQAGERPGEGHHGNPAWTTGLL